MVARRRRFRKGMLVPIAVAPIAMLLLLLRFAGDIQVFTLLGLGVFTWAAASVVAALMATAALGLVVAVWALVTRKWGRGAP